MQIRFELNLIMIIDVLIHSKQIINRLLLLMDWDSLLVIVAPITALIPVKFNQPNVVEERWYGAPFK